MRVTTMIILAAIAGEGICTIRTARAADADKPPVAPIRAVVDDYHGTKIGDPYRYFENLADPEVQEWIKGQAVFAERTLQAIPGRAALLARIAELDSGVPYRLSVVRRWPNGDLHYLKMLATENLDKLYFKDAKTGLEKLLIDPEKLATADGKHYSLSFCNPSPDGRFIVYGLAASGSEQTVLHVLDVSAGKELPDTIDRLEYEYTHPTWLADGSGFVYSRRRLLPPDAPATEIDKNTRAFLHKLGGDPDRDPVILSMKESPGVAMADTDFPSVVLPQGSKFAIGKIKHGDANELTLYAAPANSLSNSPIPWKKICDVENEVKQFAVAGDDIYLITAASAPRYKVVRTSLTQPDFSQAQAIVPAGSDVVQSLTVSKDALYVSTLRAGLNKILRVPFASPNQPEPIDLPPGEPSGYIIAASPDFDRVLISADSWTRRGKIYDFNPAARTLTDTGLRPQGKFDDLLGFEAEEVLVPSHDGVKVPISILHKTGIKLDGTHPTLVNGYGAYGMVMGVHFNPTGLAWLERGGVLAFAHVRGGGDYGKEWHLAGQKATKPNTWKDFIACCEYLIKTGYTSPAKLAGQGGSAGGILIGRAITERPDLFSGALIGVGCVDALRMETTTNGVPNIQEFGTVKTREGFDALLAMSAYHHVVDGVKYPAVLLTHGINDPRVEPWESAKMTARLQAATASGKPILFRVDYQAGHGIGSTKKQRHEMLADQWAFLLWQMGELAAPPAGAATPQGAATPPPSAGAGAAFDFRDDFKNKLKPGWSWVREDPAAWRTTDNGLEVRVQPGNMWGNHRDGKNVLFRPAPDPSAGEVDASVTMTNMPKEQYEQADLVWYYDDGNMVKCGQERVDGKLCIVMGRKEKDKCRTIKILPLDSEIVTLRLIVKGDRIRGQFRTPKMDAWQEVGECDLPAKTPPNISLQFYCGPAKEERWVKVNSFTVSQKP